MHILSPHSLSVRNFPSPHLTLSLTATSLPLPCDEYARVLPFYLFGSCSINHCAAGCRASCIPTTKNNHLSVTAMGGATEWGEYLQLPGLRLTLLRVRIQHRGKGVYIAYIASATLPEKKKIMKNQDVTFTVKCAAKNRPPHSALSKAQI